MVSKLGRILVGSGGSPPVTGYGAGVVGASLLVPGGAVAVTPANFESLILSNGSGTDFELGAGTYVGEFSAKVNNGWYGDPNDHTAVVFDGEVTYPNLNHGTAPNGGAELVTDVAPGQTFANFTVQNYSGDVNTGQAAPFDTSGSTGVLLRNLLIQDCWRGGIRLNSTDGEARFITSRYNGRWAVAGGGTDNGFYNCDFYSCGDSNLVARGVTPRESSGNRGISKFTHSTRMGVFDSHLHDQGGAVGLWWDINNNEAKAWDNLCEDITAARAIRFELSHGGSILRNTLNRISNNSANRWKNAAILGATCGIVQIEDNVINDTVSGIHFFQNNRDTQGDNQHPEFWSAMCDSTMKNNTLTDVEKYPTGISGSYTKDGCNLTTQSPSVVDISGNTISMKTGFTEVYYRGGEQTPSQWATLGYS